jgi:hypothetical protein
MVESFTNDVILGRTINIFPSKFQYCLANGAILAEIRNLDQTNAVNFFLNKIDPKKTAWYWIGATDLVKDGTFVWNR